MASKKGLTLSIAPEEIMGAEVTKSGDYRYASVGIKRGDNEYLRIAYEWKGDGIPEFVMSLMSWMQSNKEEIEAKKDEHKEEYQSLKERL
jgi:hypothetical protein